MEETSELKKVVTKHDKAERAKNIKKRKRKKKRHIRNVKIIRFFCKVVPILILIAICVAIGYYVYPYCFKNGLFDIPNTVLCVVMCFTICYFGSIFIKKWYKWMMDNGIW